MSMQAAANRTNPITIYPAIDLKDGQCVRLTRGEMDAVSIYNPDPADQAARFKAAGATYLHMVDLNGAFEGRPVNRAAVEAALKATDLPLQLGGGIRDLATIEAWLEAGVSRVILGTLAVKNPALVREACRLFAGRIAVGIDARGGFVATEGWAETSEITAADLARAFEDAGVTAIIHTDIDRDGTGAGVNAGASAALAGAVCIPVIASGGAADVSDVHRVRQTGVLEGVIIGKALYAGGLSLPAALAAAGGDTTGHSDETDGGARC